MTKTCEHCKSVFEAGKLGRRKNFCCIKCHLLGNVTIDGQDNACWVWTGPVDKCGYGNFSFEKTKGSAHRISYLLFNGNIPSGHEIRHKCHNRPCVNPRHLHTGEHWQNMRDAYEIGHSNRKFTDEQVLDIFLSTKSRSQLARDYNANWSSIDSIKRRQTYRYLTANF